METLADRIARIQERIAAAARLANRRPETVRLLGISKTHPAELVAEAYAAGLRDFGENRVQEMEQKNSDFRTQNSEFKIVWHLIGHLQSNKAKKAAALFDYVQTVDSVRLAAALGQHVEEARRRGEGETVSSSLSLSSSLPILLQVNVSGETTKEGFALAGWEQPGVFDAFCAEVEQILALPHLGVRGLMTIAPYDQDPLPTFRSTRRLRDALAQRFPQSAWPELSMGMSDDFEAAITEGSTMVRVGRSIFGERY